MSKSLFRTVPPARRSALAALARVVSGVDVQAALNDALSGKNPPMNVQDAALATTLTYGALRLRVRLTWLLGQFFQARKKSPLPEGARLVLLLAAFEITGLDRVPAYASVHWAVEAIKAAYGTGLAGMANAILRRVADLGNDAQDWNWYAGRLSGTPLLAVFHSVPEWLVELWIKDYSEERCRGYLADLLCPPVPAVRVNAARPDWTALRESLRLEHDAEAVGHSGIAFRNGLPIGMGELAKSGALSLQGAGSQAILAELTPNNWPGPIWDACAGRGGKSLALLEKGLPVRLASDPDPRRLRGLAIEARRLGIRPPFLIRAQADEAPLRAAAGTFNSILVDAPCSGLGTLTRRPDILLRRTPIDLRELAALQTRILAACLAQLRPGGQIVYITCTVSREENEAQIERFLASQPATLERMTSTPMAGGAGFGEHFFGAILRRS